MREQIFSPFSNEKNFLNTKCAYWKTLYLRRYFPGQTATMGERFLGNFCRRYHSSENMLDCKSSLSDIFCFSIEKCKLGYGRTFSWKTIFVNLFIFFASTLNISILHQRSELSIGSSKRVIKILCQHKHSFYALFAFCVSHSLDYFTAIVK